MVSLNWTSSHVRLHRTLRERQLLHRNQSVLMAVSGGQDSLCLAQLFLDLQPKWGWNLGIVHCDHGWRSDSHENADYVESLASQWGIPCYRRQATLTTTREAEARQWRYQVLLEVALQEGYSSIATGHTASDRVETLIYNLVRGSGADGLQALTWRRCLADGVELIRPLLEMTRAETAHFCQQRQLQVWEDSTNQDLAYARNRIRQDLIPYLQQHFNPKVEKMLAQTAELLQAEVSYLERVSMQLRQAAEHPTKAGLNRPCLRSAELALQRRAIRQFLECYLPEHPNFDQIEKVLMLINAPNRTRTDPFPGGAIAEVDQDWIWLQKPE